MAFTESRVSDVDVSKHSLLSMGGQQSHLNDQAGGHTATDRVTRPNDTWMRKMPMRAPKSKARKADGFVRTLCQWTVEHQVGLSINLLLLHALAHTFFPRARQSTRKFYQLSYYNPRSGKYAAGWDDLYMVIYSIVVLTGLRAAILDYILMPIAQAGGITKRKDMVRFAEQGWVLIYDSISWSLGMYIMYNHEHWMNFRELWTGWPNRELAGTMKWYYLVQFSFWLQQIVIVNIEKRRKDHWQMVAHHVITCTLMFTSYGYHWTKVGNLILCLMDVVDLFLAVAKVLKYLKFRLACDIAFGVFMLVWTIARHFLYIKIILSIFPHVPGEVTYGCYSGGNDDLKGPFEVSNPNQYLFEPFLNPTGTICFHDGLKWAFIYTLLSLQVILIIWFGMIVRVAMKVLRGGEAEDSRSDEEDNDEDEIENFEDEIMPVHYEKAIEVPPQEEEVDAAAINFSTKRNTNRSRFMKSTGGSSGVSLHSDRKELLGRIGCDGGKDDD